MSCNDYAEETGGGTADRKKKGMACFLSLSGPLAEIHYPDGYQLLQVIPN